MALWQGGVEIGYLEGHSKCDLNNPGAGTHTNDAAEVAGTEDAPSRRIDTPAGGNHGTDVADGVVAVRVVKQVEEVGAKLKVQPFSNRPMLHQREIHAALTRSPQCVATDVSEVSFWKGAISG